MLGESFGMKSIYEIKGLYAIGKYGFKPIEGGFYSRPDGNSPYILIRAMHKAYHNVSRLLKSRHIRITGATGPGCAWLWVVATGDEYFWIPDMSIHMVHQLWRIPKELLLNIECVS